MAHLLVVDDSMLARSMVARVLDELGHSHVEATNGFSAFGVLEEQKIDCVILDLLMSGLNGFDFLRLHKEKGGVVPTIVITADLQNTTRDRCIELGAVDVLHKPVDKDDLEEVLNRVLEEGP